MDTPGYDVISILISLPGDWEGTFVPEKTM
jgi:hypothetical protein